MMLGNPLLLISPSTSSGDGTNRGTDSNIGSLRAGLLGMGNESVISIVEQSTKERRQDGVGGQANEWNQLDTRINMEKTPYSFRSKMEKSGSTTVMTESYASTL